MTAENENAATTVIDVASLMERLVDAHNIPGYRASFTDEEAAYLGAFEENAISDDSAMAGSYFNPDITAEVQGELQ